MRYLWHGKLLAHCLHVSCSYGIFWKAGPPKKPAFILLWTALHLAWTLQSSASWNIEGEEVENKSYIFSTSHLTLGALHTRSILEKPKMWPAARMWHGPREMILTESSVYDRHKVGALQAVPRVSSKQSHVMATALSVFYKWGDWDSEKWGDLLQAKQW